MPLNLFVPQVGSSSENSSAKDMIVLVLSSEFPLSLKQIHSLIRKKYGSEISSQATFKALADLSNKGVVLKQDKLYSLNKSWIYQLKLFSQELETSYQSCKGHPIIENGENLSISFNTVAEVDRFILSKLECYPRQASKVEAVIFLSHLWWPLFYSFREYLLMKDIGNKINLTIKCRGNTAIDKWCAKYYSSFGFKVKTGAVHEYDDDFIVFQDYLIQIFYPKKIKKKIKETFEKYRHVEEIKITEFYSKIFENPANIQVLINKNPKLSEEIINTK